MKLLPKLKRLTDSIKNRQTQLETAQRQRLLWGLSSFLLFILSQVFVGLYLEVVPFAITLPLFTFFWIKSRRILRHIQDLQNLKEFYQRQSDFQNGILLSHTLPESMTNPDLARDLDLHVLFDQLNFTWSEEGAKTLDQWLCQTTAELDRTEQQQAIEELIHYPGLLRRLQMEQPDRLVRLGMIGREINRPFLPEGVSWRWLLPITWISTIALLSLSAPLLWGQISAFAYIALTLIYLGQTQSIFTRLQDLQLDFENLKSRFSILEKIAQHLNNAPLLKNAEASKGHKSLTRWVTLASVRGNPMVFYVLNMLVPWEFLVAELSERSRSKIASLWDDLAREMSLIDARSNLANLKIYHPTHWAEEQHKPGIEALDLIHPLLPQITRISNHYAPTSPIILITGSNMSGKSTFLRSVGMNLCLANIGAPVFASSFKFHPVRVISCIRVSDSLRDGQSYFYAEVRRLRKILDTAQRESIFFIIDEPLRGTNNKERLMGNQHFLKQLLQTGAWGLLSTHDLELTQLAQMEPQMITNAHFGEVWSNSQLQFDYKIKQGPSTTTNALKILAREGLYPKES